MRNYLVVLSLLLVFGNSAFAQKLKYKDIYSLLEKKQYEAAEPLLRKYLETEKFNANAFLYMGIISMEKYSDPKLQDEQAKNQAKNDAIYFFKQAKLWLNKKEVAKNERYYQLYKRRDVRSGVMEIDLKDILTDIDNRLEKLAVEGSGQE